MSSTHSSSASHQLEQLLAQLISKMNIVLSQQETVPPLGMALNRAGECQGVTSASEIEGPMDSHLDSILESLRETVATGEYLATCLGFPDYDKGSVMVFWENHENLCTKVIIPVNTDAVPFLDIDNAEMGDGIVSIFPAAEC